MKKTILTAFFILCLKFGYAQKTYTELEMKTNPVWIKMIDDPKANYYEAIKAFDFYWSGKIKPIKEEDILNEKPDKEEMANYEVLLNRLLNMTPAEKNEYDLMVYECKRFKNWKNESLPYVQEDGRILTIEERIQIYNKQQEEIRNK